MGAADMVGSMTGTQYLDRPGGRIAFDVRGSGPLVVCSPGMGDVRESFRFLVPRLVAAGYRVATVDLRGHGDSDTSFDEHGDVATGGDLLALVHHLGGPAVLVGNSMSAGAAVWAAAEESGTVSGLVLVGPFVRDVAVNPLLVAAMRVGLLRPWGPRVWSAYYASLYPSARPEDLAGHRDRIRTSLTRPGAWRAFQATTRTSHAPVAARLDEVEAPVLVVMGTSDPDFPDPEQEARWIAGRLDGDVQLVADAGHYPHAEFPGLVADRVRVFLDQVT